MDIGGSDAGEAYEFTRISGIVELPDGSIVVGDVARRQLRMFDARGVLTKVIGREGDGPGEFRAISQIGLSGQRLMVADAAVSRISAFSFDGTMIRSVPLTTATGTPMGSGRAFGGAVLGWLPDGDPIISWNPIPQRRQNTGVFRDSVAVTRNFVARDTSVVLLAVPGTLHEQRTGSNPVPVPYGPRAVAAFADGGIWLTTNDSWSVDRYSIDGQLKMRVRLPVEMMRINQSMVARSRSQQLAAFDAEPSNREIPEPARERARALIRDRIYPAAVAPISALLVDPTSHLWLWEAPGPDPGDRLRAAVMTDRGAFLGWLSFPSGFRPMRVGRNTVWGTRVDDDGFSHVVGYRLVR